MSDTKTVLRPLIGLMSDQPSAEIELHVVREIEKYRRLRNDAVLLEAQVEPGLETEETSDATRGYISAMIAVHAQQTVVSTLLDILGYMPEIPSSKAH